MSGHRFHARRRGEVRASSRRPERAPSRQAGREAGRELELTIDSLASGGDGVGRIGDAGGKVMFVPRTAPGDRVRVEVVQETSSFARGELREIVVASPARRAPACPRFVAGCGGCQWLHVDEAAQRAAKEAQVAAALRRLVASDGLAIRPITATVPALGWRRRARLHVRGGKLGLYAAKSQALVELDACPQLDPRLERALPAIAAAAPPDGELALAVGLGDRIALAHAGAWPAAATLIGEANIVGVAAGGRSFGEPVLELEPGLFGRADAFAQASAEGNAAILAAALEALGSPAAQGSTVLELYAGAGNLTRAIRGAGFRVTATDVVAPAQPLEGVEWIVAEAAAAMQQLAPRRGELDAIVLDPPRTGAREILEAVAALGAARLVYVSCDVATLARDAQALSALGYRAAWAQPIDTMPQTAHLEVVMRFERYGAAKAPSSNP